MGREHDTCVAVADLDKLARQTADIAANLREIAADETVQELGAEK